MAVLRGTEPSWSEARHIIITAVETHRSASCAAQVYGDAFVYSPTQWPPGPYFKGVFLRWAPYLSGTQTAAYSNLPLPHSCLTSLTDGGGLNLCLCAGMTIALMKWDTSVSSEEEEV